MLQLKLESLGVVDRNGKHMPALSQVEEVKWLPFVICWLNVQLKRNQHLGPKMPKYSAIIKKCWHKLI